MNYFCFFSVPIKTSEYNFQIIILWSDGMLWSYNSSVCLQNNLDLGKQMSFSSRYYIWDYIQICGGTDFQYFSKFILKNWVSWKKFKNWEISHINIQLSRLPEREKIKMRPHRTSAPPHEAVQFAQPALVHTDYDVNGVTRVQCTTGTPARYIFPWAIKA